MLESRVRASLVKLKLVEMNEFDKADSLFDAISPSTSVFEADESNNSSADVESILKLYEARYKAFVSIENNRNKPMNLHAKTKQREIISAFQKAALLCKSCENCGGKSPSFRKDGFTKIFQVANSSAKSAGKGLSSKFVQKVSIPLRYHVSGGCSQCPLLLSLALLTNIIIVSRLL
jgi:hypothetical protein